MSMFPTQVDNHFTSCTFIFYSSSYKFLELSPMAITQLFFNQVPIRQENRFEMNNNEWICHFRSTSFTLFKESEAFTVSNVARVVDKFSTTGFFPVKTSFRLILTSLLKMQWKKKIHTPWRERNDLEVRDYWKHLKKFKLISFQFSYILFPLKNTAL